MSAASEVLTQEFTLGYTYTRSTGPVVGRFLSGLRDGKLVGNRGSDGRVLMPPCEFDPQSSESLTDFVDVADCGEVVTWTWVSHPRKAHPSDKAFAWALIKLDGADTPMLHWVDAVDADAMATGMRVKARWAAERKGFITDIDGFVPEAVEVTAPTAAEGVEPVTDMDSPSYMTYNFTAGKATARYLHAVKEGRLVGQRCPSCSAVYIPPRGSCAACGVATEEEVELTDKATVQSFTIVHIPIPNNPIKPPYVIANLVPDGANIAFLHLLSECNNEDVRIGMRVEAVWKDESEWTHAMDNIRYFKPLDEPDIPVDDIGKLEEG